MSSTTPVRNTYMFEAFCTWAPDTAIQEAHPKLFDFKKKGGSFSAGSTPTFAIKYQHSKERKRGREREIRELNLQNLPDEKKLIFAKVADFLGEKIKN